MLKDKSTAEWNYYSFPFHFTTHDISILIVKGEILKGSHRGTGGVICFSHLFLKPAPG